jgi:hypothetical protein
MRATSRGPRISSLRGDGSAIVLPFAVDVMSRDCSIAASVLRSPQVEMEPALIAPMSNLTAAPGH